MHILYFCPSLATFVQKDIKILQDFANVNVFVFAPSAKWKTPFALIRQKLFLLIHIWKSDILICQFGGYHSFLPSIFAKIWGKKCIIVAGGTDCVGFPKIGYGNFQNKLLGLFTRWSFELCSEIWPVDESLVRTQSNYDSEQNQAQGILTYCPNTKAKIHIIHNGFDEEKWTFNSQKKVHSFITVAGGISEHRRFVLKGVDMILAAAEAFPMYSFTIVGSTDFNFDVHIPSNVTLVGLANQETLNALFQEHQYYMQLSISEGFPNAPCEAMLCGCIPIGSNVAALPLIIGDTGYLLKHRNKEELIQLIHTLPEPQTSDYERCRDRIVKEFPFSKRASLIKQHILGS
jgi:glycosyltransferase involved in cell wall biosynthesis